MLLFAPAHPKRGKRPTRAVQTEVHHTEDKPESGLQTPQNNSEIEAISCFLGSGRFCWHPPTGMGHGRILGELKTWSRRNVRIIFQPFQVRGEYCWFQSLICLILFCVCWLTVSLNDSRLIRSNPQLPIKVNVQFALREILPECLVDFVFKILRCQCRMFN